MDELKFDQVAKALLGAQWKFAKTMPEIPHWYTLRREWDQEIPFDEVVLFIRANGYSAEFCGKSYIYLDIEERAQAYAPALKIGTGNGFATAPGKSETVRATPSPSTGQSPLPPETDPVPIYLPEPVPVFRMCYWTMGEPLDQTILINRANTTIKK